MAEEYYGKHNLPSQETLDTFRVRLERLLTDMDLETPDVDMNYQMDQIDSLAMDIFNHDEYVGYTVAIRPKLNMMRAFGRIAYLIKRKSN